MLHCSIVIPAFGLGGMEGTDTMTTLIAILGGVSFLAVVTGALLIKSEAGRMGMPFAISEPN